MSTYLWGLRVRGLLENVWSGRWDKRSRIVSWCCGGSHLGRYFSKKVIMGWGKVWNIRVSKISVPINRKLCHLKQLRTQLTTFTYCVYAKASSRTSASGFFASRPLVKLSSCCVKALERHSSISSV